MTPQGRQKLEKELEALRKERPEALQELQQARAMGDLRENSAYQAARERMRNLDRRITRIAFTLRTATVVEKTSKDEIQLGSKVTLAINGNEVQYIIVGRAEADPKEKKISAESPLGKALMGRRKQETVRLETPDGRTEYKVLDIS